MFTDRDLRNLIVPLFVEQFLLMLVGLADTFVVSYVGEAAVSGVSLVNSFNTVLIFLFTALASGGAVIISQYIGSQNQTRASMAAGQLLMISAPLRPHPPVRPGLADPALRQGGGGRDGRLPDLPAHLRLLLPGAGGL